MLLARTAAVQCRLLLAMAVTAERVSVIATTPLHVSTSSSSFSIKTRGQKVVHDSSHHQPSQTLESAYPTTTAARISDQAKSCNYQTHLPSWSQQAVTSYSTPANFQSQGYCKAIPACTYNNHHESTSSRCSLEQCTYSRLQQRWETSKWNG